MSAEIFVDTNVLVYQFDASEPVKQALAANWLQRVWTEGSGRISTQVLQEFYNTVTRKLSAPLGRDDARRAVRHLSEWPTVALDGAMLEDAFRIEDRYGLSWWDSLIVAAAQAAGCRYLLTEDLHHGQDIDGLEVVNFSLVLPDEISTA